MPRRQTDEHGTLQFEEDAANGLEMLPTAANPQPQLDPFHLADNMTLRLIGSVIPLTTSYDAEGHFFVKGGEELAVAPTADHGMWRLWHLVRQTLGWPTRIVARTFGWHRLKATPLLAVLIIVETTDMVFAADSIPAVLSITQDPFIAYTSNIFAVLGLRALYFALAAAMAEFAYLGPALGLILVFIGSKLLLLLINVHVSVEITLAVVLVVLGGAVALSLLKRNNSGRRKSSLGLGR